MTSRCPFCPQDNAVTDGVNEDGSDAIQLQPQTMRIKVRPRGEYIDLSENFWDLLVGTSLWLWDLMLSTSLGVSETSWWVRRSLWVLLRPLGWYVSLSSDTSCWVHLSWVLRPRGEYISLSYESSKWVHFSEFLDLVVSTSLWVLRHHGEYTEFWDFKVSTLSSETSWWVPLRVLRPCGKYISEFWTLIVSVFPWILRPLADYISECCDLEVRYMPQFETSWWFFSWVLRRLPITWLCVGIGTLWWLHE